MIKCLQVFGGGLSSFTVVNMVAALLQHEATSGARRLPRLPPRPRVPPTARMYADLRPADLPEDLARLAQLDGGAAERLGFAMVQAAGAGWHLSAATLLEEHAHACARPHSPCCSTSLVVLCLEIQGLGCVLGMHARTCAPSPTNSMPSSTISGCWGLRCEYSLIFGLSLQSCQPCDASACSEAANRSHACRHTAGCRQITK